MIRLWISHRLLRYARSEILGRPAGAQRTPVHLRIYAAGVEKFHWNVEITLQEARSRYGITRSRKPNYLPTQVSTVVIDEILQ